LLGAALAKKRRKKEERKAIYQERKHSGVGSPTWTGAIAPVAVGKKRKRKRESSAAGVWFAADEDSLPERRREILSNLRTLWKRAVNEFVRNVKKWPLPRSSGAAAGGHVPLGL
jgi:alpha-beta hydrolase superfamily lysophospholipase